MSWDKWEKAAEKGPGSFIFKLIIFVVLLSVGLGTIGFVAYPFIQARRIVEKTLDADNVIYNYEWFKKQWRAVEAIDKKIVLQKGEVDNFDEVAGERKDWTFEDKTEYARLRSIHTGLGQQRADMVADYNAKANMVNRKIFMGRDCPEHIN